MKGTSIFSPIISSPSPPPCWCKGTWPNFAGHIDFEKTDEPNVLLFYISKSTLKSTSSSLQAPSDKPSYVRWFTLVMLIYLPICNTLGRGRSDGVVIRLILRYHQTPHQKQAPDHAMAWIINTAQSRAQRSQTQPESQIGNLGWKEPPNANAWPSIIQ